MISVWFFVRHDTSGISKKVSCECVGYDWILLPMSPQYTYVNIIGIYFKAHLLL